MIILEFFFVYTGALSADLDGSLMLDKVGGAWSSDAVFKTDFKVVITKLIFMNLMT